MAKKAKRQRRPKRAAKELPPRPPPRFPQPPHLAELRHATELVRKLGLPLKFKQPDPSAERAAAELEEARRVLDQAAAVRDGLRRPPWQQSAPARKVTPQSPPVSKPGTRKAQRHEMLDAILGRLGKRRVRKMTTADLVQY